MYLKEAVNKLKQNGYKITKPRLAVLRTLSISKKPISPYELIAKAKITELNAVTIYRILEVFEKLNLAHKSISEGGYVKCSIPNEENCHHLALCKKCSSYWEFTEEHDHKAEQKKFKNLPFKELCHVYELTGICNKCT